MVISFISNKIMKLQAILYLICSTDLIIAQNAEDNEGSGEVCNAEGSTCPDDKCCRPSKCERDVPTLKCCNDPTKEPDSSNPECSNCPLCGKCYFVILKLPTTEQHNINTVAYDYCTLYCVRSFTYVFS